MVDRKEEWEKSTHFPPTGPKLKLDLVGLDCVDSGGRRSETASTFIDQNTEKLTVPSSFNIPRFKAAVPNLGSAVPFGNVRRISWDRETLDRNITDVNEEKRVNSDHVSVEGLSVNSCDFFG